MTDKALIEAAIAVVDGWSKQRFDSRSALIRTARREAMTAMTHLDKYLPHADTPTLKPAEGKWVLIGPNNETFLGTSPIDCLRQEQKLRVPPEVALGRIARMLGEDSHD